MACPGSVRPGSVPIPGEVQGNCTDSVTTYPRSPLCRMFPSFFPTVHPPLPHIPFFLPHGPLSFPPSCQRSGILPVPLIFRMPTLPVPTVPTISAPPPFPLSSVPASVRDPSFAMARTFQRSASLVNRTLSPPPNRGPEPRPLRKHFMGRT